MKILGNAENLRDIIINEAVTALTEKPIKSTTFERISLLYKANELYKDLPWQQYYSKSIYYLLENCQTPIMPYDLILGRIEDRVLTDEEETFFQSVCDNCARPKGFVDSGHKSFWWQELVKKGITGLKLDALTELSKQNDKDKILFLEGVITIYDALILYAQRYAKAAKKEGLFEAAEVCEAISNRAPSTFREALQLLWFVQLIYCSYLASNPSLSYGRFDLILEEFYNRDIKNGTLTKEDARLLILDYYCKNNLIMGRGEHQISAKHPEKVTGWSRNLCYDSPQYLYIGGHRADGTILDGELTHLFAETIVPAFKNPVILVRYSNKMQYECPILWKTVVDKMRQSSSIIAYNENKVISGFEYIGIPKYEAQDFEHYGCNHPTLPAIERLVSYEGIVPVVLFNNILKEWVEKGFEPENTEQLYTAIIYAVKQQATQKINRIIFKYQQHLKTPPSHLEFADCFSRYTLKNAASHKNQGSKYFFGTFIFANFASFVDVFTAVDTLVIKQKRLCLSQLMEATKNNFVGFPLEYALCKNIAKFGSDDPISNKNAQTLMLMLTDAVKELANELLPNDEENPRLLIRFSTESDNGHISEGKNLEATPDGRLCGMPLAQNSSPAVGASVNGLTARLSSVSSLPFERFTAGAQNISIQKSAFVGKEGLVNLASILGGYFDLGGLQVQITAVDTELLRDAQKNPDAHRDLMVRITGYSAVFNDLTTEAQNDIINREEMK